MKEILKLQYKIDKVRRLIEILAEEEKDIKLDFVPVGREQRRNWKTQELEWEDEERTIPRMKDVYDLREKGELSEEDEMKLKVLNEIENCLLNYIRKE